MNLSAKITGIESELKYNKSRMFKRAHFLVRSSFMTFSQALKQVWAECKEYRKELREEIDCLYSELARAFVPAIPASLESKRLHESMNNAYNNGTNLNKF